MVLSALPFARAPAPAAAAVDSDGSDGILIWVTKCQADADAFSVAAASTPVRETHFAAENLAGYRPSPRRRRLFSYSSLARRKHRGGGVGCTHTPIHAPPCHYRNYPFDVAAAAAGRARRTDEDLGKWRAIFIPGRGDFTLGGGNKLGPGVGLVGSLKLHYQSR